MSGVLACLRLAILGIFLYDPKNPIIYFSIGQLIAAIALFLAFTQLKKPIIKFRIIVGKIKDKTINIIFIIAIIFVFIAAFLPFIPGHSIPFLGYPIFWEFIAGGLFVGGAIYLIITINKQALFSSKNAKYFLKECTSMIAKGNDEELRELADEINVSIEPIIKQCKSYDVLKARDAKERGEQYELDIATAIAFSILDLWSDKSFCKNIVCKVPRTASEIFKQIINYKLYDNGGYALTRELLHQAFSNQDSILMKESDYSGLGFFKKFTNTIFNNWEFVESNHRPLQSWEYYENQIKPWQVEKYCSCLKMSIHSYFKAEDFFQFPSALYVGIDELANFALYQISSINNLSESDLYKSINFDILSKIQHGFEEIVDIVEKYQDEIPDYELNENDYDRFEDKSIYGVVAYGIYEYFEKLAMVHCNDRALRMVAIELWIKVFDLKESEQSKSQLEIGKRLLIHINKKIDENLDEKQRWYPAITRLIINLNGINESDDEKEDRMGSIFHRDFIKQLKTKYPILANHDPKFAADLLPENVIYDKEKNELRKIGLRQGVTILKLDNVS